MAHLDDFDSEIDGIISSWERAEVLISAAFAKITAEATPSELTEAMSTISEILNAVLSATLQRSEEMFGRAYRQGMEEAVEAMALEFPERILRQMVEQRTEFQVDLDLLKRELSDDMARAANFMSSDARRILREIGRNRLSASLVKGNPVAQIGNFQAQMEERGVSFVDRDGRKWKPSVYARNVLLTQTGRVLNSATANTALAFGSPGVRIADGGPGDVDTPCLEANGQAWSIAYFLAHLLEHNNCRRSGAPLSPSWRGTLDRVMPGESEVIAA